MDSTEQTVTVDFIYQEPESREPVDVSAVPDEVLSVLQGFFRSGTARFRGDGQEVVMRIKSITIDRDGATLEFEDEPEDEAVAEGVFTTIAELSDTI